MLLTYLFKAKKSHKNSKTSNRYSPFFQNSKKIFNKNRSKQPYKSLVATVKKHKKIITKNIEEFFT